MGTKSFREVVSDLDPVRHIFGELKKLVFYDGPPLAKWLAHDIKEQVAEKDPMLFPD